MSRIPTAVAFGLGAVLCVLVLLATGCAAHAQDATPANSLGAGELGAALGTLLVTAAGTAAATYAGTRRTHPSAQATDLAPLLAKLEERERGQAERDRTQGEHDREIAEVLGRLDERTKTTNREIRRIRDTQHDQAQALTALALTVGSTPPKPVSRDPDDDSDSSG